MVMGIEAFNRHERVLNQWEELLAVEEDRIKLLFLTAHARYWRTMFRFLAQKALPPTAN